MSHLKVEGSKSSGCSSALSPSNCAVLRRMDVHCWEEPDPAQVTDGSAHWASDRLVPVAWAPSSRVRCWIADDTVEQRQWRMRLRVDLDEFSSVLRCWWDDSIFFLFKIKMISYSSKLVAWLDCKGKSLGHKVQITMTKVQEGCGERHSSTLSRPCTMGIGERCYLDVLWEGCINSWPFVLCSKELALWKKNN